MTSKPLSMEFHYHLISVTQSGGRISVFYRARVKVTLISSHFISGDASDNVYIPGIDKRACTINNTTFLTNRPTLTTNPHLLEDTVVVGVVVVSEVDHTILGVHLYPLQSCVSVAHAARLVGALVASRRRACWSGKRVDGDELGFCFVGTPDTPSSLLLSFPLDTLLQPTCPFVPPFLTASMPQPTCLFLSPSVLSQPISLPFSTSHQPALVSPLSLTPSRQSLLSVPSARPPHYYK